MLRFLGFALVLAAAVAAPASALVPETAGTSVAGEVALTGQIQHGSGFTVRRRGPGQYAIAFPHGTFATGCVAVVVEGSTSAILSVATQRRCPEQRPLVYVDTYDVKNDLLSDQNFQFVAVEENP